MTTIPTKEKLPRAIEERAGLMVDERIDRIVTLARAGHYDDFESELGMPLHALVHDLRAVGFADLATRAINGEFDSTKEEADAWANKPQNLAFFKGRKPQ